MKEYKKPEIINKEITFDTNVCRLSNANNSLNSFENDGYGIFEDFEDVQ